MELTSEEKQNQKQALRQVMARQRDLSCPFNSDDPAQLREWMHILKINQVDLAKASGVAQSHISGILRGAYNFVDPSKAKLWQAINNISLDNAERDILEKFDAGGWDPAYDAMDSFFKTPLQKAMDDAAAIAKERDTYRQMYEGTKQLLDMDLVKTVAGLAKQLTDAHEQIADLHRLLGLKSSAVVAGAQADELQEQIEAKLKGKP